MTEELIDALDKNGQPTGEKKTKLQIFDDGDWRRVIHVWIVNGQHELLVQQRARKGLWDDLWDVSVGGAISSGEEPAHAAARELDEELGLKVKASDIKPLGVWEVTKPLPERHTLAKEFSQSFLLRKNINLSALRLEPKEVAQVKWLPLATLKIEIANDTKYKNWVPHPREYYLEILALITHMEQK
jgi:isopentenyl-diphosphate delta-isomerase